MIGGKSEESDRRSGSSATAVVGDWKTDAAQRTANGNNVLDDRIRRTQITRVFPTANHENSLRVSILLPDFSEIHLCFSQE
jgi:hypothetical protein